MIISYRSYELRINILTYNEDDLEWELENDDNDQHTECLDTMLHDDEDEINELIIESIEFDRREAEVEKQLSDLELN